MGATSWRFKSSCPHHKNKGHHLVWCSLFFVCAAADAPTPAYEASQKGHFFPTRWRSSPRLACNAKMFATHHKNKGHHLVWCSLFFACAAADAPTPAYEASQKGHFFPTRWRSSPRLACNAKMFATHHSKKAPVWVLFCSFLLLCFVIFPYGAKGGACRPLYIIIGSFPNFILKCKNVLTGISQCAIMYGGCDVPVRATCDPNATKPFRIANHPHGVKCISKIL